MVWRPDPGGRAGAGKAWSTCRPATSRRPPWQRLAAAVATAAGSAPAVAAEPESAEFRLLFLLFLAGFTAIMLWSSLPRRGRADFIPPELLRTFARSKALAAVPPASDKPARDGGASAHRRHSSNPAAARPARGGAVFRGQLEGLPITLDEAWGGRSAANAWQGQPYLRLSVALPDAPRSLELRPAGLADVLRGRAGLLRRPGRDGDRGRLVARFSRRPLDRSKERMFLSDARRRILEDFEAEHGGLHMYDGRLFVIRHRFDVNVRELDRLYDALGSLVRTLRENP